jgi:iron complex transport system substrate-binding protein
MQVKPYFYKPQELTALEVDVFANLTRRRFLTSAGGLLLGGALAVTTACGRAVQLTPAEQLPANPQRIIVGNTIILDALLALDAPVIGAPTFGDREPLPPYLASLAQGIQSIGDTTAPNAEAIAALQPDLIIIPDTAQFLAGAEPLLAIAPVASVPAVTSNDWQTVLRRTGDLTGRETEAENLLASWNERATALREQLRQAPQGEVSIVRYFNNSARYLPGRSSFAGQVLDAAGVPRPPIQADGQGKPFVEVSLEEMTMLDGDIIFVITVDSELRQRFEAQPLWRQLRAVQNGRVYAVDQHWFSGNILAAHAILDDLERHLLSR